MKKIDEAVKRFGAPDYGRTAKRLRDFEAELVGAGKIDVNSVRRGMPLILPPDTSKFERNHIKNLLNQSYAQTIDPVEIHTKLIQQRAEIEALQQLLNEKDYEIDMLRNIKPVSTRDLWFTAGLVALIAFGAYMGFM